MDILDEICEAFDDILDNDGDITFEAVKKWMDDHHGVNITPQEYRAALKLY